jgi:hypothetical protein
MVLISVNPDEILNSLDRLRRAGEIKMKKRPRSCSSGKMGY